MKSKAKRSASQPVGAKQKSSPAPAVRKRAALSPRPQLSPQTATPITMHNPKSKTPKSKPENNGHSASPENPQVTNLAPIKSQSGVELTEKIKELLRLAQEQGYLTYNGASSFTNGFRASVPESGQRLRFYCKAAEYGTSPMLRNYSHVNSRAPSGVDSYSVPSH